ncbi:type II toxin-antitoxin system RelE/ParE family toxin [Mucilaginibacter sp. McL0603]|uniref:type II toxin-antitoxin system RelE/ParE family toxin n=1 Tax=Mucilaginibacter sp. McL0603 TaxID=3415670 RepID=UPI003CEEE2FE
MAEVKWTKQAIQDIDKIAEFIAKDSDHYAKIQVQRFFDAVKVLEKQPKSGKIVPEKQDISIRAILIGSYRIIYKIVSEKRIDVITVHHNKRLLSNNPGLK